MFLRLGGGVFSLPVRTEFNPNPLQLPLLGPRAKELTTLRDCIFFQIQQLWGCRVFLHVDADNQKSIRGGLDKSFGSKMTGMVYMNSTRSMRDRATIKKNMFILCVCVCVCACSN